MKYEMSQEQLQQMEAYPWLTDQERQAFELYYRHGWHLEDIAAEMDCSRKTVGNRLRSVRRKAIPS